METSENKRTDPSNKVRTSKKFETVEFKPFYCFNCGHELEEIGLGFLNCKKCDSNFLPFIDLDGLQCLSNLK